MSQQTTMSIDQILQPDTAQTNQACPTQKLTGKVKIFYTFKGSDTNCLCSFDVALENQPKLNSWITVSLKRCMYSVCSSCPDQLMRADYDTAVYSANFEESPLSDLKESRHPVVWEGHGLLSSILTNNSETDELQVTGRVVKPSSPTYDYGIEVLIQLHPVHRTPSHGDITSKRTLPPMKSLLHKPNTMRLYPDDRPNIFPDLPVIEKSYDHTFPSLTSSFPSASAQTGVSTSPAGIFHLNTDAILYPNKRAVQKLPAPAAVTTSGYQVFEPLYDQQTSLSPSPSSSSSWSRLPSGPLDDLSQRESNMVVKKRRISTNSANNVIGYHQNRSPTGSENAYSDSEGRAPLPADYVSSSLSYPRPPPRSSTYSKTTVDAHYHQSRRKKRDTKPPNANDIRPFVEVKKNKHGEYILPAEVDSWTVLDLGKVVWDRDAFHNQRYIYPVGYRVKKWYRSMVDPHSDTQYTCQILDGGDEPIFQLDADDNPGEVWRGPTPTTVWTIAVRRAFAIRNMDYGHNPVGPDFFGLRKNTIAKMIQDLPDANKCKNYIWQNFEAMSGNKGKAIRRINARISHPISLGERSNNMLFTCNESPEEDQQSRSLSPDEVSSESSSPRNNTTI
ncbi:hypothetical protein EC973_005233 [Apophysomyces ossiformis]|uniref:Ams2/SPT21 N-terminal domain-containing protein n=1 Tax=Apophysomyces ossiformis TaxID=679940 RepID=A0A8H7EUK8_9FUNG|nr:hypothetical protein EC973_005233 [Apophysomyces ossiformis]